MDQQGIHDKAIYSDSYNAILWVRNKHCKTENQPRDGDEKKFGDAKTKSRRDSRAEHHLHVTSARTLHQVGNKYEAAANKPAQQPVQQPAYASERQTQHRALKRQRQRPAVRKRPMPCVLHAKDTQHRRNQGCYDKQRHGLFAAAAASRGSSLLAPIREISAQCVTSLDSICVFLVKVSLLLTMSVTRALYITYLCRCHNIISLTEHVADVTTEHHYKCDDRRTDQKRNHDVLYRNSTLHIADEAGESATEACISEPFFCFHFLLLVFVLMVLAWKCQPEAVENSA